MTLVTTPCPKPESLPSTLSGLRSLPPPTSLTPPLRPTPQPAQARLARAPPTLPGWDSSARPRRTRSPPLRPDTDSEWATPLAGAAPRWRTPTRRTAFSGTPRIHRRCSRRQVRMHSASLSLSPLAFSTRPPPPGTARSLPHRQAAAAAHLARVVVSTLCLLFLLVLPSASLCSLSGFDRLALSGFPAFGVSTSTPSPFVNLVCVPSCIIPPPCGFSIVHSPRVFPVMQKTCPACFDEANLLKACLGGDLSSRRRGELRAA